MPSMLPAMLWRSMLSTLLKDPLSHFLVGGLILFAVTSLLGPGASSGDTGVVIEIDGEMLRALETDFQESHGRPPTGQELDGLVSARVDQELLFRTGLELGLDRGDPIVRRRVIQKMGFLLEELYPAGDPSEEELALWMRNNEARYQRIPAYTIEHIFFDSSHRSDPERDALEVIAQATTGGSDLPLGDPFLHGQRLGPRPEEALARDFGRPFADAVKKSEPGQWVSARSPWGWHAVQVVDRATAGTASEVAIRRRAELEWRQNRREERQKEAILELRRAHPVEIHRR